MLFAKFPHSRGYERRLKETLFSLPQAPSWNFKTAQLQSALEVMEKRQKCKWNSVKKYCKGSATVSRLSFRNDTRRSCCAWKYVVRQSDTVQHALQHLGVYVSVKCRISKLQGRGALTTYFQQFKFIAHVVYMIFCEGSRQYTLITFARHSNISPELRDLDVTRSTKKMEEET